MKEKVKKYYLKNENVRFSLLNLGSTIVQLDIRLSDGTWQPTVLSYESNDAYTSDEVYLNSIVGPYAGRIKGAEFCIEGKLYTLTPNEGINSLHSGTDGLHRKYFSVRKRNNKLITKYKDLKKNKEFPASCVYQITYTLLEDGLEIDMKAYANGSTLLNLTQHTYFNLNQPQETINNHELQIASSKFYCLDEQGIPCNKNKIANSVFDFNEQKRIQTVLCQEDEQFKTTGNIDHPFQIDQWPIKVEGESLLLNVYSDAPDCVIYLANSIDDGKRKFKHIGIAQKHAAIAIEPQTYPNAINLETESNQIYKQGKIFKRKIQYKYKLK